MKSSLMKKHILILTTAAVLCIVGLAALARLARSMSSRLQKVIAANEQLASYEANKKIFAQESKSLADIAMRTTALEAYRITPDTVPEFLSSIEAIAQKNGIQFSITTVSTPGTGAHQKLLVDFSATGSQKNVDAFLNDLTHQSYEVAFTKFSFFAGAPQSPSTAPSTTTPATSTSVPTGELWQLLGSIQVISY